MVGALTAMLAVVVSAAWTGVGRPAADVIVRGQLYQEMDLAAAALTRDLSGGLANPEGRLGGKTQGCWVGWMQPAVGQLWLCFDGGDNPNGVADWGPPDTVVLYQLSGDTLVRWDWTAGTTFTVARNVTAFQVSAFGGDQVQIQLTFSARQITRSCTLIARIP